MSLPDASVNKDLDDSSARARVQRFGGYLAGMIMPNIGAFIAWGLITALFIPDGWLPNETFAELVGPTITYLLPILIGYTGGRMVHGQRGAVIGATATMGAILAADVPMFLGAMIMGPLAAWVLKHFDRMIEGKVTSGFEMLVDNFSLGILGALLAIIGRLVIGPVVDVLVSWLGSGVGWLVDHSLLPLASIFIEPAKVLFLNNAINHGVLSPLGAAEAQETGRSVLFMLESNPGPGLGLLLAFIFFGPRSLRGATWGSAIIHFLGGIHEIYFPYILMKPKMIIAVMAGGAAGVTTAVLTGAGLVAPASPGSIIAYGIVTPRGAYLPVIASVVAATVVTFLIAALLFGFSRGKEGDNGAAEEPDLAPTAAEPSSAGVEKRGAQEENGGPAPKTDEPTSRPSIRGDEVTHVVIACDAGMGSSVMVAGAMKKHLAPHGVSVTHSPINELDPTARLIMCQRGLAPRVRKIAPDAVLIVFDKFVGDPAFTALEAAIREGQIID